MGLRSSAEGLGAYSPFVIQNPSGTAGRTATSAPAFGVTVGGARQNITLNRILACEGQRSPPTGLTGLNTSTLWNQAFILLIP